MPNPDKELEITTCGVANPGGTPCTKTRGHEKGHDPAAYGPSTDIPMLDDDAVAEIAGRDWHLNDALEKRVALSTAERDGLVAMVRMFNEHYENLMRAALLREQNAASSIRSACVEKVKAMGQQWYAEAKKRGAAFSDKGRLAETIAKELESVSIQEQEN